MLILSRENLIHSWEGRIRDEHVNPIGNLKSELEFESKDRAGATDLPNTVYIFRYSTIDVTH